jgi:lipopolysaccharide transport system ATP-binding protein
MSFEIALRVENLSRCYKIDDKLRDRHKQLTSLHLQSRIGKPIKPYHRKF